MTVALPAQPSPPPRQRERGRHRICTDNSRHTSIRLLDGGGLLPRDGREKHVAAEQGVADRDSGDEGAIPACVDNEATGELVPDNPKARFGEEREIEVGRFGEGTGGRGEGVGHVDGVEIQERADAEDRRRVELM